MSEFKQQRLHRFEQLVESDPDVVVDVLEITSEELCLAFPERVRTYLNDEVGIEDEEEVDA